MIKPLHDKLAVVRLKASSTTSSGIIVEKGLGEVDKAKIVAIGPKVTEVKVGDTVLVDWNKAAPTKMDDIPVYILKEENIVGVYED